MTGSKLYFIAAKQGFVVSIGPQCPWIFSRDVREAKVFHSFEAADALMKESNYTKHYAVLTTPTFLEPTKPANSQNPLPVFERRIAFFLGGVATTSLIIYLAELFGWV